MDIFTPLGHQMLRGCQICGDGEDMVAGRKSKLHDCRDMKIPRFACTECRTKLELTHTPKPEIKAPANVEIEA